MKKNKKILHFEGTLFHRNEKRYITRGTSAMKNTHTHTRHHLEGLAEVRAVLRRPAVPGVRGETNLREYVSQRSQSRENVSKSASEECSRRQRGVLKTWQTGKIFVTRVWRKSLEDANNLSPRQTAE